MSKFTDLGSKFSKTNVRLEISTFDIEYMQNFINIRMLIQFGLETFENQCHRIHAKFR